MCLGLGMLISCVFGFVFGLILGTTEMPWGQNADWPTEEMRGRWVQSISISVSINDNHPNNCDRLQRICHVLTEKETKLCSQEFILKGKLISWEFFATPSRYHNLKHTVGFVEINQVLFELHSTDAQRCLWSQDSANYSWTIDYSMEGS